jgi:hypothetical protein
MSRIIEAKSAQVTVFIIIGIILLFSVGIYSYMKSTGISPANLFQPKSPPVVAFIESCLERTATEAIKAMGDQGGFITLPTTMSADPTKHLSLIPGVGGEFAPKVPFWYYDGRAQVPSIRFMEIETERYIDTNLKYCLNNYQGLTDEFIIKEKSNYSSSVVFADKESIIGLDYRIEITPKGSEEVTSRDQFVVRLDVKVKRMHELAKELLEAENKAAFFENMTINLMSAHPPEDIPFTGLTLKCGRMQWLLSDIKKKIITALEPAVTGLRFRNTDHEPFLEKEDAYRAVHAAVQDVADSRVAKPLIVPKNVPADSYEYFQYYFTFTEKDYKDFKVLATYKNDWGMNLLATPNQYGVMKSGVQDLKSQIMSFLCLNTYHFVYDLVYPVMININDPDAFHQTGYVFRYAFPIQIFHNAPNRGLLATRVIEPTEYAMDYCDFYAPEDRVIVARDIVTNAELSRVNLTFTCIKESCILGVTKTDNAHLQWRGKFPEGCYGPIITANRSGYLMTEEQYDYSDPFYIDMYPTQPVQFQVRRHTSNAPGVARPLSQNMYAIIQIEHAIPPVSIFDVFGAEDTFNRTSTVELLRSDATYNVNIMLLERQSKEEDRLVGGWIGNWTVRQDEILDAKKVIFHVPQQFPSPKTDAEVVAVYGLMTNRSLFPEAVPEIIRSDEYTGEAPDTGGAT